MSRGLLGVGTRAINFLGGGPLADFIQAVMDDLGGGSGGGFGLGNVFTYREGAVGPLPQAVFPTFAEAIGALNATGVPGVIYFDDSLGTPVIPGGMGAYDTSLAVFLGNFGAGNITVVHVLNGATFTTTPLFLFAVNLISFSASPVVSLSGGAQRLMGMSYGASLLTDTTATAPFVHISAGSFLILSLDIGASLSPLGATPVIQVDAGSFMIVFAGMDGRVENSSIVGAGTVTAASISTSAQIGTQPGALAFQNVRANQAERLTFSNGAASSLWNVPAWTAGAQSDADTALTNLVVREQLFTFRPGDPSPSGMVFSDWNLLLAAAQQAQLGPRRIFFDASLSGGGFCPVPSGGLFGGPTTFEGNVLNGNPTRVVLAEGVVFDDWVAGVDVQIECGSVGSPIRTASGLAAFTLSGSARVINAGPQPFLIVSGGGNTLGITLRERAAVSGAGLFALATAGARLDIDAYDLSSIAANTVNWAGAAAGTLNVGDGASVGPQTVTPTVPVVTFLGTFEQAFTQADLVANVLTVTHDLGSKYVVVQVYDDADQQVAPDFITLVDRDHCTVDLTSFAPLLGTWNVVVRR